MNEPIASIILRGSAYDWYALPIVVIGAAIFLAALQWRFFVQWLNGIRGRNWPAVTATIDIVDVTRRTVRTGRGDIVSYIATLTYFYRNPELQTGDYSREFNADEEQDARAWADSYKGSTVTIHVYPRDPSRSVLRKEDI
jgi:Protein of unknown function (DUF3592)